LGTQRRIVRSRPVATQIAEKTIDYPKFAVDGRHFVDTFLLAHFYDVGMRSLSGFERTIRAALALCDSRTSLRWTGKKLEREYNASSERSENALSARAAKRGAVADLLSPS